MRTILHIGTHKTGTSSIQNFLANNRDHLARGGIHFATSVRSARNVNALAADVACGRHARAEEFVAAAVAQAERRGCETLLLSAESFYAMTAFFYLLLACPVDDYWEAERAAISRLLALLPEGEVSVICYLRRQDMFVESLYNQFVKQAPGYAGTIEDFVEQCGPLPDYDGHLRLWTQALGREAVQVRSYERARGDLVEDFAEHALRLRSIAGFRPEGVPVNAPLGPDLLDFKRALNCIGMPLTEAYVVSRTVARLAREMGSPSGTPRLLDAAARQALLQRHQAENEALARNCAATTASQFFDPPEPSGTVPVSPTGVWTPGYLEAVLRYRREMRRPSIRLEILLRRGVRGLLQRFPGLERGLAGPRRLLNRRRVRLEREGRA